MVASTNEAVAFNRRQHEVGANWQGKCLMLQRIARGLPSMFPSAVSAQHATPMSERIEHTRNLKRGMVAYFDDPNDSNPFGHIAQVAGWVKGGDRDNPDNCILWTNDAPVYSRVGLVRLTYFRAHWGDSFQFGATWLNGVGFPEFNKKDPVKHHEPHKSKPHLGATYQHAINLVHEALQRHKELGETRIVNALQRDLVRMAANRDRFSPE